MEGKWEKRKATAWGNFTFRTPYGGRATFDWWLDRFGHDVIVECTGPWKGLRDDWHRIGMGPSFSPDEARQLAEKIARRIIGNLDSAVENVSKDDAAFDIWSYYDKKQLPLYRKWAWEEAKRRMVEIALAAEAYKDEDDDDETPDNTLSEDHIAHAEAEFAESNTVELIAESEVFTNKERGAK